MKSETGVRLHWRRHKISWTRLPGSCSNERWALRKKKRHTARMRNFYLLTWMKGHTWYFSTDQRTGDDKTLMTLEMYMILVWYRMKFNLMEPVTQRTWEITSFIWNANAFLSQKWFLVCILWVNNYKKGIVRGISKDLSFLEINDGLNRANPCLRSVDFMRMKQKEKWKFLTPPRLKLWPLDHPSCSQSLFWLHYCDPHNFIYIWTQPWEKDI